MCDAGQLQLLDISIHAPRGGSDGGRAPICVETVISIHAPRGGSDVNLFFRCVFVQISIHAPRGGSDQRGGKAYDVSLYFNPRSPWGERHLAFRVFVSPFIFQSTLPVGGATPSRLLTRRRPRRFQSTLPVGGATLLLLLSLLLLLPISIHAPRGGSDSCMQQANTRTANFNPRSPWGERHASVFETLRSKLFQSTLPVGGATFDIGNRLVIEKFQSTLPVGGATVKLFTKSWLTSISIHAPRGGSDIILVLMFLATAYFNPRSPWGERLVGHCDFFVKIRISIHAPRGGSDRFRIRDRTINGNFNPRSPWGERPCPG